MKTYAIRADRTEPTAPARRTDPVTRVRRDLATAVTGILAELDTQTTPETTPAAAKIAAAHAAAAAEESRQMAELITEAEATDGTWRGEWIGDTTALFA